ncbi:hypothetical protein CC99x_008465 [Candidatus Berkiella cookevillensis]|uniref:Uncharacterized protein n=1 Tax=Candidatus Berkiella cookevillensis TaxID=437022 RepID=A0A0Q9YFL6_9GAMM|nr:hypothetical protein [Candidatus Berkiella cookevillensis]MCS5708932.1 hypothetical protein [Candidatus Berkiella cookevillensis]
MAANIPKDWKTFSKQYDRAYAVVTRRVPSADVRQMFTVELTGEYISAGYQATSNPNGRPHAYADGVHPFKEGMPHGPQNQGFKDVLGMHPLNNGRNNYVDEPYPDLEERDDLRARRSNKPKLTPYR